MNNKKIDTHKIANIIESISNDIIISEHKNADFDSICPLLTLAY